MCNIMSKVHMVSRCINTGKGITKRSLHYMHILYPLDDDEYNYIGKRRDMQRIRRSCTRTYTHRCDAHCKFFHVTSFI